MADPAPVCRHCRLPQSQHWMNGFCMLETQFEAAGDRCPASTGAAEAGCCCQCRAYTSPTAAACPDYGMTVTEAFRVAADIEAGKQPPTPHRRAKRWVEIYPQGAYMVDMPPIPEHPSEPRMVTITLPAEQWRGIAAALEECFEFDDSSVIRQALQPGGE